MLNDTGGDAEKLRPGPTLRAADACPILGQPFACQRKAQPRRYCSRDCAKAALKRRQASQPPEIRPQSPMPANSLP